MNEKKEGDQEREREKEDKSLRFVQLYSRKQYQMEH